MAAQTTTAAMANTEPERAVRGKIVVITGASSGLGLETAKQVRSTLPTRSLPTPQDIAAVILFLGSPVNRQITGEVIRVTGGRHS